MSKKREGPELQMQDVRLACGELNERERVAVQWTLDRHNEIVGSMCSKEGPSDEEIEREVDRLAEESTAPDKETPNWMKADIRRGIRRGIELARAQGLSANPMAWMNEHGEVIRDGVRGMVGYSVLTYNIPLYRRDHFPRSPKDCLTREEAAQMIRNMRERCQAGQCDHALRVEAKWADASLQGEGSSSLDLGDAVQSDGPGDPAVGCPPPHDLTHGQATSPTPPIALSRFPLHAIHDKARTARELDEARVKLRELSLAQLGELLSKTKHVNEGVSDAEPWIRIIDEEIALRFGLNSSPAEPPIAEHPQGQPSHEADKPVQWYKAQCGVCNDTWRAEIPDGSVALKAGTFCPACQARKIAAPGVLNWDLYTTH